MLSLWCVLSALVLAASGTPEEERLWSVLFQDYNKSVKPATTVMVNLQSFTVLALEMFEDKHVMQVSCYMGFSWKDHRLAWKSDDYNGLDRLQVDQTDVWRPDVSLYNSASKEHMPVSNTPGLIMSDGKVMHFPGSKVKFSCVMDLTYWPHDTHNCSLKLGSWVHHGQQIDFSTDEFYPEIELAKKNRDPEEEMTNSEWEILETAATRESKKYDCCPEDYVSVNLNLIVRRSAPAYAWVAKVPAVCLSLVSLVVFVLPPGAVAKVVFGGVVLLTEFQFLAQVSAMIGHSPSHTPLIVQMVCQQMVLVVVSVVLCGVVVRMARGPHTSGLPGFVMRPASLLASVLCLGNYATNIHSHKRLSRPRKPNEVELGEDGEQDAVTSEAHEWLLLAALTDRLALLLYTAITLITLCRFAAVL